METKKEIYIIILGGSLIALFLFLIFVYSPFKEIQQKSQELISQKNSAFLLEKEFNKVENFKKRYESHQFDLEKIDNLFIDPQNPVKFIEYLEKSASELGISLEISTPSFLKEEPFSFVVLQLFSSGDFSKILLFARELEAGPYLVEIQNLNIENYKDEKASKKQTGKVAAAFLIKILAKPL